MYYYKMFQSLTIISVALLLTVTAFGSAEEDRSLISKLNSNIELNKVSTKPANSAVAPAVSGSATPGAGGSGETLKTAETRPALTGSDFITSSHTEQSYSSSASFESSGASGSSPSSSSTELGGGRGPSSVNSQAASSNSYQVSGESSETQAQPSRQSQAQAQPQQGSPETYSSAGDETASAPASAPSYGRPDLNEADFARSNGYQASAGRNVPGPYGSSFELPGPTFDLQRNPEPGYDSGASGEYNGAQGNVANENGYNLNHDTSVYEDSNSNEDEGSPYRTQDPEGSQVPLATPGSGPENQHHHQQQSQQQQQNQPQQAQPQQQSQQAHQQQQPQQQQPSGPRKTSTLSTPGPIPDYGGFRPVIKSQTIPTPPIPGPQRPNYALAHGEPYRSVSINYEPPKSIYSYEGLTNQVNNGGYNGKGLPGYGQNNLANGPNGYPYPGDSKKMSPMTIGYDELVKPPTPSAAEYHAAGPHRPHGSEYIVSHGPPQHAYGQGPPQVPYGQPPQAPQGQQGPHQMGGGYGQPITYQATPIGYAQPDAYDQQPNNYEQPPQQGVPPPAHQQGPPSAYGQQAPPMGYEQTGPQVPPPQQQGPPQGAMHAHPPQQNSAPMAHPPPPQVQQSPPVYGPPQGPRHSGPPPSAGSHPGQYESEAHYGPPPTPSVAPVNYEQTGPNEYQQTPSKPVYEQTTSFVESSGYPGNLGPAYGAIKDGPGPMTASVNGPAPTPLEGYSGNMANEYENYPSSYDSIENSAGPSNYPSPLSGYNSQGSGYSSGGYSLPDDSYMQSLFGFPTYDVTSGKGNPYAAGSNPIPSGSAGSYLSGSSGKPASSFLPSIKFTGNGIKFSGFGSSLTGGLGSINQAIASTLGSGLSSVTGPGLGGLGSSLTSSLSSTLGSTMSNSGLGSGTGMSSPLNGSPLHSSSSNGGPISGLSGQISSLYNNLSGLGSPFGGLGGLNYGTAASKLIPQAIRAPFRSMYRALVGGNANANPAPTNG